MRSSFVGAFPSGRPLCRTRIAGLSAVHRGGRGPCRTGIASCVSVFVFSILAGDAAREAGQMDAPRRGDEAWWSADDPEVVPPSTWGRSTTKAGDIHRVPDLRNPALD